MQMLICCFRIVSLFNLSQVKMNLSHAHYPGTLRSAFLFTISDEHPVIYMEAGFQDFRIFSHITNLLLTEREGRTGEYWPEVVAVRTECSEVRTKTTEGQYSPVRLEQARLVSSLLYGTRVMLVSKLPTFENKKYTSYDHFHGNGPYGKIPTKKEPIRTPGFTPRLPCHIIMSVIANSRYFELFFVYPELRVGESEVHLF